MELSIVGMTSLTCLPIGPLHKVITTFILSDDSTLSNYLRGSTFLLLHKTLECVISLYLKSLINRNLIFLTNTKVLNYKGSFTSHGMS